MTLLSGTQLGRTRSAAFYRRWHRSHGIDVNDAILAGTASATGGKIYTQNRKGYPMPDVAVLKGWWGTSDREGGWV